MNIEVFCHAGPGLTDVEIVFNTDRAISFREVVDGGVSRTVCITEAGNYQLAIPFADYKALVGSFDPTA